MKTCAGNKLSKEVKIGHLYIEHSNVRAKESQERIVTMLISISNILPISSPSISLAEISTIFLCIFLPSPAVLLYNVLYL